MRVFVAGATGGKQLALRWPRARWARAKWAVLMTELRGASKAKRELGWQPRHPSWRQGVAT